MESKKNNFNLIEKLTFALGIIVTLSLFTFLIYQLIYQNRQPTPPQLVITTFYEPNIPPYAFKVLVENIGNETAEETNIQLSLFQEGKEVEKGTINILYVPIKSKETSWIVFHKKRKPNDSLVVSSVSYVQP